MDKRRLIIFGLGDFAKLTSQYFANSPYQLVAFSADKEYLLDSFLGYPVLAAEDLIPQHLDDQTDLYIAIGYRNMRNRAHLFERFQEQKVRFASYISPDSCIHESVTIGKNSFIMPGVVIEPNVSLGENNILWSNATICHDAQIGSHNFIAANATVGGFSKIGNNCFLGFSSVVLQNLALGNEVLLGANSLLRNDSDHFCRYVGNPARQSGSHVDQGICIHS